MNSLRQIRTEKGITQEKVAELLNITRTTVTKWESGVSHPRADTLPKLAAIFNCSIDELFKVNDQSFKK